MRLLILNPNSTEAMTKAAAVVAARMLPEAEVLAWTNRDGPPAIQGPEDGDAAVPGVLGLLPAAREAAVDAIVLACFDDTGLREAQAAAHCPVLGIGQAAFHMAALGCQRFSVVTTLAVSVPVIEANVAAYGFGAACARVRPSASPSLRSRRPGLPSWLASRKRSPLRRERTAPTSWSWAAPAWLPSALGWRRPAPCRSWTGWRRPACSPRPWPPGVDGAMQPAAGPPGAQPACEGSASEATKDLNRMDRAGRGRHAGACGPAVLEAHGICCPLT